MPRRSKNLRPGLGNRSLAPVVANHCLSRIDPVSATRVNNALLNHLADPSKYFSAIKRYAAFCEVRRMPMYPADALLVAAYIDFVVTVIKVSSLNVYLSAIRHCQLLEGIPWTLERNDIIRKMLRFVKKRHPGKAKGLKFPLSISVLRKIFPLLHNWPHWELMSHNDRLIVAATVVGVSAFLRGGEFLASPRSKRPILGHSDIIIRNFNGKPGVVVNVVQPKNLWWIEFASVTCFDPDGAVTFGPVTALGEYRKRSTVLLKAGGPAFVMSNGRPLSRDFWVSQISSLIERAGVSFVDENGITAKFLAASCRAGAVRSALDAKIDAPTIKALGRWRSVAWESYAMNSISSLQEATARMWQQTSASSSPSLGGGINPEPQPRSPDDIRSYVNNQLATRSAANSRSL